MRSSTLVLLVLFLALGILVFGAWRILHEEAPVAEPAPHLENTEPAGMPPATRPARVAEVPPSAPVPSQPAPAQAPAPLPVPADPESTQPTNQPAVVDWEERLDQLLDSDLDDKQMRDHILALWPFLPATNRVEAAQFLADFTSDESYSTLQPILLNPARPA